MKNFVFGYACVSNEQQCLDRQLDMLEKYGVDKMYNEKMTGTKRSRLELEKLLERLTEGDTVVIESLSGLGRSTKDLIWLMETFNSKGVNLVSLKESIDTTTSTGKLLFTLMSALAQFERDVIAEGETFGQGWHIKRPPIKATCFFGGKVIHAVTFSRKNNVFSRKTS